MIGMSYESIKTVVLTILVLISIVLTWSLWTYQPQYDDFEKTEDLLEEITTNDTKDITSLIKPTKILFHINDQHFSTFEESEVNKIMNLVKTWEIGELENISRTLLKREYLPFLKQSGHVEIHFTDSIPIQIFKSIFTINDKDHSSLSFDRIVIDVNSEERGEGTVYFVSNYDQMVFKAKVNSEHIKEFERNYYPIATRYPEQQEHQITDTLSIFLPKERTKLIRVEYFTDPIETETFIERLFAEPTNVKKDVLTTGEVHTDGSRILRVHNDQKYIEFVNPMRLGEVQGRTTDLIRTSIDYVNEHVGWTGSYRFFEWDVDQQKTVFRLYSRNYPVFNRMGLTEIIQQWDNNEIVKYVHPSMSLRVHHNPTETLLPSGTVVMEELKRLPNYDPEKLEYVTIGYELQENMDISQFVTLQPIWCYRYNGTWMKLEIRDSGTGGNEDGLE